jgi:hypothetical protein
MTQKIDFLKMFGHQDIKQALGVNQEKGHIAHVGAVSKRR